MQQKRAVARHGHRQDRGAGAGVFRQPLVFTVDSGGDFVPDPDPRAQKRSFRPPMTLRAQKRELFHVGRSSARRQSTSELAAR